MDLQELQAALEGPLKSSLEPAIRQDLLEQMNDHWQSSFAAGCTAIKEELHQQVRRDLMEFATQTLAASGAMTNQRLRELIGLIEAARIQDRRRIEAALEHIGSQFGNGLVTLAVHRNELRPPEQN